MSENKRKTTRPLVVLKNILDRILGFTGGLVVAGILSFLFLYARALLHFSGWIWAGGCFLAFVFFAIYGLWRPGGFDIFSGPLLSAFLSDPGPAHSAGDGDDDVPWKEVLLRIFYCLGLVCLGVGALFVIHVMVIGGIGLVGYYIVFELKKRKTEKRVISQDVA
jgi:hypothetical protein